MRDKVGIIFSNPGNFRIDVEVAKSGGVSDPRNSTLIKMFNLIDVGERAGSGIPNIFSVWKKMGLGKPEICEVFEPDRVMIRLPLPNETAINRSDNELNGKKIAIKQKK